MPHFVPSGGPKRKTLLKSGHVPVLATVAPGTSSSKAPPSGEAEDEPFSRKGWIFELKYDGYRLLAAADRGHPYLRYRNGHDATALFPEITRTLKSLPVESILLDGEIVVLDGESRPSFSRDSLWVYIMCPAS